MATAPVVEPVTQAPPAPPVEPLQAAPTPAAAAQPTETAADAQAGLPDELLKIPALTALLQGQPPAMTLTMQDMALPEIKAAAKYAPDLQKAGIGLYRPLAGDSGVLFNQFFIDGPAIQQADKAGQLLKVAPPFQAVNQAVSSAPPDAHPAMLPPRHTEQLPVSSPQPTTFNPASMPAEAQTQAAASRMKNLSPGKPSEGARPGAGRLLNEILKRPV